LTTGDPEQVNPAQQSPGDEQWLDAGAQPQTPASQSALLQQSLSTLQPAVRTGVQHVP
jgi:hypothetical protein